jgi:hypothetical protein
MVWSRFHKNCIRLMQEPGLMIVTRHNARSWVGVPLEVTDTYVILGNGADKEVLYFSSQPNSWFTIVRPPGGVTFGIGEHRLPLEDYP